MAAPSVKTLNTFDAASSLVFSGVRKNAKGGKMVYVNTTGGDKTFFELPVLRAPFGLSSYTDQTSGNVSYSLDVSLEDQATVSKIREIESMVLEHVSKYSEEILGRKYSDEVIRQALFKSCIRESKDGKYAPTLKLKVMHRDGVFSVKAFDTSKRPVEVDTLQKGQRVKTIIDFNQIWIIDNRFGLSVRLKQVMMLPTTELTGCAFTSTTGGDDDCDEEIVDQVVNNGSVSGGDEE